MTKGQHLIANSMLDWPPVSPFDLRAGPEFVDSARASARKIMLLSREADVVSTKLEK